MALISPTLPTIGQPNATEDPDIRATLQTLVTLVNGNLDTANIATSGVASGDIATAAVTKAKLATDALNAFLQLGTTVLGLRAEFGVDSVSYGGGGTSIARSPSYTALSGNPKFAVAVPFSVNSSGAHPLLTVITAANTTALTFSVVDCVPGTVIGAGTYTTYWLVIG